MQCCVVSPVSQVGQRPSLPFGCFYGQPSLYIWEDDEGTVHHVRQGEGGELFSLGLHRALVSVKSQLEDGEKLFAFLDDVHVICRPTRVLQVFKLLEKPDAVVWRGDTQLAPQQQGIVVLGSPVGHEVPSLVGQNPTRD